MIGELNDEKTRGSSLGWALCRPALRVCGGVRGGQGKDGFVAQPDWFGLGGGGEVKE